MFGLLLLSALAPAVAAVDQPVRLACPAFMVEIDPRLGTWSLVDAKSGVRWPTEGTASAGEGERARGRIRQGRLGDRIVSGSRGRDGHTVSFEIVDDGRSLQIRLRRQGTWERSAAGGRLGLDRSRGRVR